MNVENKSTEEQPNSSQLELFLANIANQTKDPTARRLIQNVTGEYLAETKTPITDQCFFANEIGVRLYGRMALKEAAECFQFAFLHEDPYNPNKSIYAASLVNAIDNNWQDLPAEFKLEDVGWLEDKKPFIQAAINCIDHFRLFTIYKEGYGLAPKESNGGLRWNTDNLEHVNMLHRVKTKGKNLLTQ